MRVACADAHRVHVARVLAGKDEDRSIEAAAGAILHEEKANDIHALKIMIEAYLRALAEVK